MTRKDDIDLFEGLISDQIVVDHLRNGEIRSIPAIDLNLKDLNVHLRLSELIEKFFGEKSIFIHRIEVLHSHVDHRRMTFFFGEEFFDVEMLSNVLILSEDVELIETRKSQFQIMKGTRFAVARRLTNFPRIDEFIASTIPTLNQLARVSFQLHQTFFQLLIGKIDEIGSNTTTDEKNEQKTKID